MRLLCPKCSEPINVPDDWAGRVTNCPLCGAEFTVPALFAPAPTSVEVSQEPASALPQTASSRSDRTAPSSNEEHLNDAPSSRCLRLTLSPKYVLWVPAVCSGLAIVLTLFFSWNGAFPGGHAVYTQGAFRALLGKISIDPDGENVFRVNPVDPPAGQRALKDQVRSNWLLLLVIPLLFLTFVAAIFFPAFPYCKWNAPAVLQPLMRWGMLIVAGLSGLTFLLLAIQATRGFGLENAIRENARAEVERTMALPDYPSASDYKRREIFEGSLVGRFQVEQTTALRLIFVLLLLSGVSSVYAFWFNEKTTDTLAPRLELHW